MLENMPEDNLRTRYNSLIKFNNTLMAKIEWLREKITEAGGDVHSIGWCKHQYDRCSFIVGDDGGLTREEVITACRRLEGHIQTIIGVENHTTMAYRENAPVTYCPLCKDNVRVSYKLNLSNYCVECNNRKGLRMVK
jgi:hypothetical protein